MAEPQLARNGEITQTHITQVLDPPSLLAPPLPFTNESSMYTVPPLPNQVSMLQTAGVLGIPEAPLPFPQEMGYKTRTQLDACDVSFIGVIISEIS